MREVAYLRDILFAHLVGCSWWQWKRYELLELSYELVTFQE